MNKYNVPLIIAGSLVGLVAFYAFIWAMAYPMIGEYCKTGGTVKTSILQEHSAWSGDRYLTTFDDNTSASTRYVKPGQFVCIDSEAHFLPWEASKQ